mmetsp:Transcript_32609/g.44770  ORF Transcript_32609/g.44770 Transcript_32609/m.44770 type:complete len:129 (+) Transcript_32609:76-462(+)
MVNANSARALRQFSKKDLLSRVDVLKKELLQLRCAAKTSGTQTKACKQRVVRRSIARVLTVLNQTEKENLRKFYDRPQNKRKMPKFLKPKLTKAKRQALKPHERNAKSLKQVKKMKAFPKRTYFVKAA